MLRTFKRAKRTLTATRPSSYRTGKYKRTKSKMTSRKIRKITKSMIMAKKETKRLDYAGGTDNVYHNTGALGTPNSMMLNRTDKLPAQGDGDSGRDGNDIYGVGWTIRIQTRFPWDRLNTKLKFWFLRVPKGYNPASSYTNMFDNITGNVMLDPIDKDRVHVLTSFVAFLKDINPAQSGSVKDATTYHKVFIPLKKTIKFWDDGAQDNSMPYDYFITYAGYDTTGTLPTDVVATTQIWSRFTYKDL